MGSASLCILPLGGPWGQPPLNSLENEDGQGVSETLGNHSAKTPFTFNRKRSVPTEIDSEYPCYISPLNCLSES